jgi:2-hydroxychromene-2-carboxylate isomerase
MTLDFYLDFISPFGYLARARVLDIAKKHGLTVTYRPIDIFHVKTAAGNTGPSNSQIPAKLAYMTKDRERWADLYGLKIAKTLAGFKTAVYNRGLFLALDRKQADAYVEHAYACVWRDSIDPGAESGERELEKRMGWKVGELSAFANSAEATTRFDAENAAAVKRGVFGVPTFVIGDEMWWGNDRVDFMERWLAAQNK